MKNKQPLPQIPGAQCNGDTADDQLTHKSSQSVDNIYEDDNELQNFESVSQGTKSTNRHESTTVTPSSYSESSLDAKSHDCLSNRSSSKKRVNIRTDPSHIRSQRESPEIVNYEDLESGETSVLNVDMHSLERYNTRRSMDSNYLTITGKLCERVHKLFNFNIISLVEWIIA